MKTRFGAKALLFSLFYSSVIFAGDIDMNFVPEGADPISVNGSLVKKQNEVNKHVTQRDHNEPTTEDRLVFLNEPFEGAADTYKEVQMLILDSQEGRISGSLFNSSTQYTREFNCYVASQTDPDFIYCTAGEQVIVWMNPSPIGNLLFYNSDKE